MIEQLSAPSIEGFVSFVLVLQVFAWFVDKIGPEVRCGLNSARSMQMSTWTRRRAHRRAHEEAMQLRRQCSDAPAAVLQVNLHVDFTQVRCRKLR